MKKVTFTVAQVLFLHKVRRAISYSSDNVLNFLDDNKSPTTDVKGELSEEDITNIADSIQEYIDGEEVPSQDLTLANEILEVLGLLPKEETATDGDQHGADAGAGYANQDGFKRIRFTKEEYKYQVFLDGCISSFFQNLK